MEILIYTPNLELTINDGLVIINYMYEQIVHLFASIKF